MFSRSRHAAIISSTTRRSRADMPAYVNGISTFWNLASRCAISGATWEGSSDTAASRAMASSFMARDSNTCDQNRRESRDEVSLSPAEALLHRLDLAADEVDLREQLFDFIDHLASIVLAAAMRLALRGQRAPELGAVAGLHAADGADEGIDTFFIDGVAEDFVRRQLEDAGESEKETEIEILLVTFDPGEGGSADLRAASKLGDRKIARLPCGADSGAYHLDLHDIR